MKVPSNIRIDNATSEMAKAQAAYYGVLKRLNDARQLYADVVVIPYTKTQIGECFKSENGYSGSKRWWTYSRVVGTEGECYLILHIDRDSNGRASAKISLDAGASDGTLRCTYIPITDRQFRKAVAPIMAELMRGASAK